MQLVNPMIWALPISCAWMLSACAHGAAHQHEAPMTSTDVPWSRIDIADGAANAFHFTRADDGRVRFVYVPVTPAESSSGLYSGGPPRREELAANDARLVELWDLLGRLEANQAIHTPDRNKGTGAIAWDGPAGKRDFIIQMGAAPLNELLALLARFGS